MIEIYEKVKLLCAIKIDLKQSSDCPATIEIKSFTQGNLKEQNNGSKIER